MNNFVLGLLIGGGGATMFISVLFLWGIGYGVHDD